MILRQVVPLMKAAGQGQIIATNSVRGAACGRTGKASGLYCASKYALDGLLGCLRAELSGTGVKLGQVYPGGIDTPWFQEAHRGGVREQALDTGSFLTAEDVAEAISQILFQSERANIERVVIETVHR
jgi:NADP-dependent 3-hydroxy acid dehydrogenase YdfG